MDFSILWTFSATTLVAILGWLVVHSLSETRDRRNRQSEMRIRYLLDAYRKLESVSNRAPDADIADDLESAIADIHLLGSAEQSQLALDFSNAFAAAGEASANELLWSLRDDLRSELRLPAIRERPGFLRIGREPMA